MAKTRKNRIQKQPTVSATPSSPITVVLPKDRFTLIRIILETVTVFALLVSLLISYWSLKSAQHKEIDASRALTLANEALTASQSAQQLIESQKATLTELTELEKINSHRARIGFLTVSAENGDRNAFNELLELTSRTPRDIFDAKTPEDKNIQRILSLYRGSHIGDPFVAMTTNTPPFGDASRAAGGLGSASQESRSHAINAVRRLRVNASIPQLIDMVSTEPDMHVLQLLGIVIPEMLRPVGYDKELDMYDLAILTQSTVDDLRGYWNIHSNALLAIKPKYWKVVKNPPYANMSVLTDPHEEESDN